MAERAQAFHCPYCGDDNLRPHSADAGSWECHSCLRAFTLRFHGLIRPSDFQAGQAPGERSETPS